MAQYKILRVNKLTCGSRRGLVDMDIQIQGISPEVYLLPATNINKDGEQDAGIATESNVNYEYARTQAIYDYYDNGKSKIAQEGASEEDLCIMLDEQQPTIALSTYNNRLSAHDGLSGSSAIQLTPESWLSTTIDLNSIDSFNSSVSAFRVVYEFELDANANAKSCLSNDLTYCMPLNDLLDLCIKSMFKKAAINYAIPGNLLLDAHNMTYSKNVDQYFVFEENPVAFCQFNGDAFMISQPMTKQPYRMQSNIYEQISSNNINDAHTFQLTQDDIETVLYNQPSEYGFNNYTSYLGLDRSYIEEQNIINMLTPKTCIKDIKYNYIVEVEQNTNINVQFDNPTIYDNGDIFGFFTTAKNMYDALYSMKMDDAQHIRRCRTYIDVQDAGNSLLLKYYDDTDYSIQQQKDGYSKATMLSSSSSATQKYPYQKVEMFKPVSFGHPTQHKSNVFSLKIYNSGLDEDTSKRYTAEQKQLAEQIKKDIMNSMKALAESIAPANTQLFTTYFINPS